MAENYNKREEFTNTTSGGFSGDRKNPPSVDKDQDIPSDQKPHPDSQKSGK